MGSTINTDILIGMKPSEAKNYIKENNVVYSEYRIGRN
jgi:hypothetical protein